MFREYGNSILFHEKCLYIYKYIYFIYTNLPVSDIDYPILGAEIARARKRFWHPLLTSKPATMTQSAQTTIPPSQP